MRGVMKKILASICVALLTMSVVSCGSSNNASGTAPANNATGATTSTETKTNEKDSSSAEQKEETSTKETAVQFESFTPIDNDECSVIIKDIDPKNTWGYTVKAELENKSTDKTYMFSVETASINGVEADPLFATEVAPGKKSNNDISFTDSSLKEAGITDVTDIEIVFRVYDTNDWSAADVAKETFHVYPLGEDKATTFVRETKDTDEILVDNEQFTVLITDKVKDPIWGYTLKLFIENKTDTTIMVAVEEASVNGYMADPFFAKSVYSGKCAFTSMSWSDTTLKENGITDIENIEFRLHIYNSNDFSAGDFFNEVVSVNP